MEDVHILNVQKSQDTSKVYYNDPLGNAKRKGDAKYAYDDMCNKNAGCSKLGGKPKKCLYKCRN